MNKNFSVIALLLLFAAVLFYSCEQKPSSITNGEIKIAADESLIRLVKAEKAEFEKLYPNAKLDIEELSGRDGFTALLEGKIQLYVGSRDLNKDELDFIQQNKKLNINQFKFCYDGIVALVQKNDQKVKMTTDELIALLNGKDKSYKIYMPQFKSGTYEYIKNSLLEGKDPLNVKLLNKETDVLEAVKKNPKSIGLVGLNVIADSSSFKFLNLSTGEIESDGIKYYPPHMGYLILGSYPLFKLSYVFTNEPYVGVAGGFATFLTGNEGQAIVLANKLGPLHSNIVQQKNTNN